MADGGAREELPVPEANRPDQESEKATDGAPKFLGAPPMAQWSTGLVKRLPGPAVFAVALLLVAVVGVADRLTGPELSFALFYLVPIFLAAWAGDLAICCVIVLAAAASWLLADLAEAGRYSHVLIPYWNALVRLVIFGVVGGLFRQLRRQLEQIRDLAETDTLTGLANRRRCFELLEAERLRARRSRRPLSIAYLDLDGFKAVNDASGHASGDRVLRCVADTLRAQLRASDVAARVGGDEFAILLPETSSGGATVVLDKVRTRLAEDLQELGFRVTASVGAATLEGGGISAEELVKAADRAMYGAKKAGGDRVVSAPRSPGAQDRF